MLVPRSPCIVDFHIAVITTCMTSVTEVIFNVAIVVVTLLVLVVQQCLLKS